MRSTRADLRHRWRQAGLIYNDVMLSNPISSRRAPLWHSPGERPYNTRWNLMSSRLSLNLLSALSWCVRRVTQFTFLLCFFRARDWRLWNWASRVGAKMQKARARLHNIRHMGVHMTLATRPQNMHLIVVRRDAQCVIDSYTCVKPKGLSMVCPWMTFSMAAIMKKAIRIYFN